MTDSSSLNTHHGHSARSGSAATSVNLESGPLPHEEVEDYTIKCICGYQEDDGSTVFCERCETWQHTECYYINEHGVVPTNADLAGIDHLCADCHPRLLDAKGAIDRQRRRREGFESGDRKSRKATSKGQSQNLKKKLRVSDTNGSLTNGWTHGNDSDPSYDRTSRSPRDPHHQPKRLKTNHRLSNSMHIPAPLPNPTSHPHKRAGSITYSPIKQHSKYLQNGFVKSSYSKNFLHLYDNDPGDAPMRTNLLSDIKITQDLAHWSYDVQKLSEATNGLSPQDVFNRCDQPVDSMPLPQLSKRRKEAEILAGHGVHPKWTYLTIDTFTPKDSVVGELKGKIGHMSDYIYDQTNRWDYLRHPAPFVFFHPKLPIYIDTRSEGTTCRYLRRSCTPNLSMKTFLENGSEYHFCFLAKQDLDAGSELTIGWVLDEHIRSYFTSHNPDDIKFEGDFDEDYVTEWVGKVLAEFGGCACQSQNTCAFARYDRRSTIISKAKDGHLKKQNNSANGYGTKSGDGSDQDDSKSPVESKSASREMSPARHDTVNSGFGNGLEISDREKRKIAALEKNFEQLENDRHQPAQKKKKRHSGGSNVTTPSAGISKQLSFTASSLSQPNTPGISSKTYYADASTSRRKSGSPISTPSTAFSTSRTSTVMNSKKHISHPNTPLIPSPLARPNYVDSSVQTEPDEDDEWFKLTTTPVVSKKPYMSLTKRLLLRSQQDRAKLEERRRISLEMVERTATNGGSGTGSDLTISSHNPGDLGTQDAGSRQSLTPESVLPIQRPSSIISRAPDHTYHIDIKHPPLWPSVDDARSANGPRPNDLQVQAPPRCSLPSESAINIPLIETPSSTVAQPPSAQNLTIHPASFSHPSSTLFQPSPIKKKVSLGEYFSRRKGSQPATEVQASSSPPMQQGVFKPPANTGEEIKEGRMQGSANVDMPKVEKNDTLAAEGQKDSIA